MNENKIVIVNYGIGNLVSVQNMLRKAEAENVIISSDINDIESADKLILPGVGHFDYGMKKLKESGLIKVLERKVLEDKIPILGICLGAQLMTKGSDEGTNLGLGWVDAKTIAFDSSKLEDGFKIPHMGWNYVTSNSDSDLFKDMYDDPRFYFVHSYHLVLNDIEDEWLTAHYGYDFCAAYQKENIYACQFHPEKSHKYGLKVMENFVKL
ncbi:MAG: glutamine amidotransferase [Bacteroidia bacterium]|jgi:glutamine amidotransferase